MGKKSKVKNMTPGLTKVQNSLQSFLSPRIGTGATKYEGQLVADLIPEMTNVRNSLANTDLSMGLAEQKNALLSALGGTPSYQLDEKETARYFESAVATPMMRTFDQTIAPRLQQSFANLGGSFSSRKSVATSDALQGMQTSLASQLGQAQMDNMRANAQLWESAKNRQLQAVGMMEAFANAPATRAMNMTQALSPFQQHAQNQAQAQFQEFMRMAPENDPWMRAALPALGAQPQTIVQQPRDYSSLIGGALGLAAAPFTGGLSLLGTAGSFGTALAGGTGLGQAAVGGAQAGLQATPFNAFASMFG